MHCLLLVMLIIILFPLVIFQLDGRHVVFGKVLEGEDVVKRIEGVGSNSGTTTKTVTIADSGELQKDFEGNQKYAEMLPATQKGDVDSEYYSTIFSTHENVYTVIKAFVADRYLG